MRTILYIINKEFRQIVRDKFMRIAIIAIPILQTVVLVYAATFELKEVRLSIVDRDKSQASHALTSKYRGSTFFRLTEENYSDQEIGRALERGSAGVILLIPGGFGNSIHREKRAEVALLVDAVNGSAAELSLAYCRGVIMTYSKEILINEFGFLPTDQSMIEISSSYWHNPLLDYKIFMAPGILGVLVTIIGWLMTAMNIVKEKEQGTIEQLNVTPIRKYQFLAGKLVPFLLIGLFDLAFGLSIAKMLYNVPIEGSLLTLFGFATVYLFTVLGIGLFISTISQTQQQVLFVSFFFVMMFTLMSGLFTAVENMPRWGQVMNWFNPLYYFIKVIRMVLLKGSGLLDISRELLIVFGYAVVINLLAVWRYRKTV